MLNWVLTLITMSPRRQALLSSGRLAGQVVRYHTWPMLHRQTNAEHTWQVLRVYYLMFGAPRPEVTTFILWHDAGELKSGDLPFPIKATNPVLKQEISRIEADAVQAMGGVNHLTDVRERVRVKLCDLIEMMEQGLHELRLGNHYAEPIVDDTMHGALQLASQLSTSDRAALQRYVSTRVDWTGTGKQWKSSAPAM